jgi:predicted phage terminase large subunit-like protein
MPRYSAKAPLSSEEKKELIIALAEMQARGLPMPEIPASLYGVNIKKWPIDSAGYFISNNGKRYIPTEQEAGFISSTANYSLFRGSRGSGKTAAGAQKTLKKIMQGESGAVINPSFEDFKSSTWPEFREWIPWEMVVPSQRGRANPEWEAHQPFTMVFVNGARAYCKGLRNPNSARGPNINWLWYDEARNDDTGMGWTIAVASVRIGKLPQRWATTTPTYGWLNDFFMEKKIPQDAIDACKGSDRILIETFHGTIHDNKDNLDPGFYATMLAAYPSGWLRSQEIDGEFVREGGKIGDRTWFDPILKDPPEDVDKKVRFWDLAATEKKLGKKANDPDETVGSLVSKKVDHFYIEEQVGGFWEWGKIKEAIANTARRDGPYVPIYIEQEPAAGGKNQVAELIDYIKKIPELSAHKVEGRRPEGDRVMAANVWFAYAAQGKVHVIQGLWNSQFLDQVDGFTQLRHDDRVTSISGAIQILSPFKKWCKIPFFSI